MFNLVIVILMFLASFFPMQQPSVKIDNYVTPSCIQLVDISGPYTYPSIYVVGLPADIEIAFINKETVYRFQGLNDEAIRAQLPVGDYTVIAYHGLEQVSNIYYFTITSNKTLMLHVSIPEECYPKPKILDHLVSS